MKYLALLFVSRHIFIQAEFECSNGKINIDETNNYFCTRLMGGWIMLEQDYSARLAICAWPECHHRRLVKEPVTVAKDVQAA